jgi:hypothetical protein
MDRGWLRSLDGRVPLVLWKLDAAFLHLDPDLGLTLSDAARAGVDFGVQDGLTLGTDPATGDRTIGLALDDQTLVFDATTHTLKADYERSVQKAQDAADGAQDAADKAQEAADKAQEAADKAQETADAAQETADGAQSAAETAQGAAETAQGAAEAAQAIADGAAAAASGAAASVATLSTTYTFVVGGMIATSLFAYPLKSELGALAYKNAVDWNAPDDVVNKPAVATTTDSIVPATPTAFDLGSTVNPYRALYVQDVVASGTVTQASDETIKVGLRPLEVGLDLVERLRPVSFRYRDGGPERRMGLGARHTRRALESLGLDDYGLVDTGARPWTLAPMDLVGLLVKCVQELHDRVRALERQIETRPF